MIKKFLKILKIDVDKVEEVCEPLTLQDVIDAEPVEGASRKIEIKDGNLTFYPEGPDSFRINISNSDPGTYDGFKVLCPGGGFGAVKDSNGKLQVYAMTGGGDVSLNAGSGNIIMISRNGNQTPLAEMGHESLAEPFTSILGAINWLKEEVDKLKNDS